MEKYSFLFVLLASIPAHIYTAVLSEDALGMITVQKTKLALFTFQSLILLVYPLLGHLADVWLTRYKVIAGSIGMLVIGSILALILSIIDILWTNRLHHPPQNIPIWALLAVGIFIICVGKGLFGAIVIQFGLDQLLDSPTEKLSAFIHWYYWSQETVFIAVYYGTIFVTLISTNKKCYIDIKLVSRIAAGILVSISIGSLVLFCCSKKQFHIQRTGLNPFRNIYKVLQYTWKHKVPVRRSAFTYWENDIPPRIDVGKDKYGGPFTTEEVENTKTFLRIVPLIISLFGFYLINGKSAVDNYERNTCPSRAVLAIVTLIPHHLSALVVVVSVPLYQLVIKKCFPRLGRVLMLTRMWVGLYLSLVQVVIYLILALNHDTTYMKTQQSSNRADTCLLRLGYNYHKHTNVTCKPTNDPIDNTYLLFIIPQLLNGVSSLLVFMTALEFICAQAPRSIQGLLVGVWYATSVYGICWLE